MPWIYTRLNILKLRQNWRFTTVVIFFTFLISIGLSETAIRSLLLIGFRLDHRQIIGVLLKSRLGIIQTGGVGRLEWSYLLFRLFRLFYWRLLVERIVDRSLVMRHSWLVLLVSFISGTIVQVHFDSRWVIDCSAIATRVSTLLTFLTNLLLLYTQLLILVISNLFLVNLLVLLIEWVVEMHTGYRIFIVIVIKTVSWITFIIIININIIIIVLHIIFELKIQVCSQIHFLLFTWNFFLDLFRSLRFIVVLFVRFVWFIWFWVILVFRLLQLLWFLIVRLHCNVNFIANVIILIWNYFLLLLIVIMMI